MPPAKVDKSIKNYLLDFGLTEKEVKLYLTLLKSGPNTIMNLARETGIKRSTTHNNIEELIKKGLVSQTNYGERRMVVAEHPEKLSFLMDQKRWDVKKLEEILPDVITKIVDTVPEAKETTKVEVKYYEGVKGVSSIYNEVFVSTNVYAFANSDIVSVFPENPSKFIEAHKKNKTMNLREILTGSESLSDYLNKMDRERYEYKIAPESLEVPDYLIYDGKVAIIDVVDEVSKKVTGVVVESNNFYESMKKLFGFVWDSIELQSKV